MKTSLLFKPLLVAFLAMCSTLAKAQALVIQSATPNSSTIQRYEKLELTLALTAAYTNPYDYDQVAVSCEFILPSGKHETVDGFYMEDFVIGGNGFASATGTSGFKVRYSPVETGTYSYIVSVTTPGGTASLPSRNFQCTASGLPGFIRKNSSDYLGFDNGAQYIPIGENMGWQNSSVVGNYTTWLDKLSANGGNFIRVWMSSWAFALEWKNGTNGYEGLKKYKQSSAYYLDWLLDYCKQKNVYMMLALNNHGQVSSNVNPEWSNNPYNAANGGPATNTWDFFTNSTARSLHKNRLRYIVARYGYSRHIQSWELFNELHWTDQFEAHKNDLTAWDAEMAAYLKSKDVNKHLVTTSYGGTEVSTNTWNLPDIDFTQTHFYVNSPNIETVLADANQNFLARYQKPTLNGEFGLGPSGNTLTADDPQGVHIHNAIWGSLFSGGLGSGMTWWWDDYIEPNNLYHHYAGLSAVTNLIDFKNDNYKKRSFPGVSGGGASDLTITPGGGFAKAAAANFTIDAAGTITPSASSLSQYIFGSVYNTEYRNPPTFTVNFPVGGQFKVKVAGVSGSSPKITISFDGIPALSSPVTSGGSYSISVPAGQHSIKVDNPGVDWFQVSNYVFTNIDAPLKPYVLTAEANNKAVGYLLNNKYNWQYLKANNNVAPPAVTGSTLTIGGMANGNYQVAFYSTSTGMQVSSTMVTVSNGALSVAIPDVAWDLAFRATEAATLPLVLTAFKGERMGDKNRLLIDIAHADNVKDVYVERSAEPSGFAVLQDVGRKWRTLSGKHAFIDEKPLKGVNYYRLKIVDTDGGVSYSSVVKLAGSDVRVSALPNPFTNTITVRLQGGRFAVRLLDAAGRQLQSKPVSGSEQQSIAFDTAHYKAGIYYVAVYDAKGTMVARQPLVK